MYSTKFIWPNYWVFNCYENPPQIRPFLFNSAQSIKVSIIQFLFCAKHSIPFIRNTKKYHYSLQFLQFRFQSYQFHWIVLIEFSNHLPEIEAKTKLLKLIIFKSSLQTFTHTWASIFSYLFRGQIAIILSNRPLWITRISEVRCTACGRTVLWWQLWFTR